MIHKQTGRYYQSVYLFCQVFDEQVKLYGRTEVTVHGISPGQAQGPVPL